MKFSIIIYLIVALFLSVPASGEINKCADAEGHVTYSSKPCKGSEKVTPISEKDLPGSL